jgi:hypothetical protein
MENVELDNENDTNNNNNDNNNDFEVVEEKWKNIIYIFKY